MRLLLVPLGRLGGADPRRVEVGVAGWRFGAGRGVSENGEVIELWLPRRGVDVDTLCSEPERTKQNLKRT